MEFLLGFIAGAVCGVFLLWFAAWLYNRTVEAENARQDAYINARRNSFIDQ